MIFFLCSVVFVAFLLTRAQTYNFTFFLNVFVRCSVDFVADMLRASISTARSPAAAAALRVLAAPIAGFYFNSDRPYTGGYGGSPPVKYIRWDYVAMKTCR
jgi:hypothetical protein